MSLWKELLKEYSNQQSDNICIDLAQNTDLLQEIITNLGGLDAILSLCLNNDEYCDQHITKEKIITLKKLLLKNSINNLDEQPKTKTAVSTDPYETLTSFPIQKFNTTASISLFSVDCHKFKRYILRKSRRTDWNI